VVGSLEFLYCEVVEVHHRHHISLTSRYNYSLMEFS
jgi:hypothetical protein